MEFSTYTLPNGIRGIHRQVRNTVAHCALVIGAGSRDEHPAEYGLAHLTEHAFFKGTERRKAWQVNCRLENLGGELNAFTTKEDTTIHATTLKGDFAKAAELIADIAFRSTFPDRELEREKEVIADEINTYKDSPADLIYDTFEDMLFEGSELGHNILGRKAALMRYDGQAIRAFTARTHTTDQMVFSSIGNFSAKTAEAVAARYFASQPASQRGFVRAAPAPYRAFEKTVSKHTHQTHCIIGSRAFGISEDRRRPVRQLAAQRRGAREERTFVQHRSQLHALRGHGHRGHLFQFGPQQRGAVHRADRRTVAQTAHRAADGAPAIDGQETVHRPAGHIEREQRKLHARGGQKPARPRRHRHHGAGLRQGPRPDGPASHGGGRGGFFGYVTINLQIR